MEAQGKYPYISLSAWFGHCHPTISNLILSLTRTLQKVCVGVREAIEYMLVIETSFRIQL